MTAEEIQAALDDAERLHERGARVNQDVVGSVQLEGEERMFAPETWLALRAILIGRGFASQDRTRT